MSKTTSNTLAAIATAIVIFYIILDLAAFEAGKKGKSREWYHFLPGGGIVRLYEATHQ